MLFIYKGACKDGLEHELPSVALSTVGHLGKIGQVLIANGHFDEAWHTWQTILALGEDSIKTQSNHRLVLGIMGQLSCLLWQFLSAKQEGVDKIIRQIPEGLIPLYQKALAVCPDSSYVNISADFLIFPYSLRGVVKDPDVAKPIQIQHLITLSAGWTQTASLAQLLQKAISVNPGFAEMVAFQIIRSSLDMIQISVGNCVTDAEGEGLKKQASLLLNVLISTVKSTDAAQLFNYEIFQTYIQMAEKI